MINNDDLLKETSHKELKELSDLNASGEMVQEVIDDAIADALSFISSFILIPIGPTPLLKKIAVELTIYELRKRNDLVSEEWDKTHQKDESYLLKMSKGTLPTTMQQQASNDKREYSIATKTHKPKIQKKGWL